MKSQIIRSIPTPLCICCQSRGTYLYRNLKDRLFDVAGEWHFKKCNNKQCGLIWQDPMPIEKDLHLAYKTYYTHQDTKLTKPNVIKKLLRNFFAHIKQGYLANKYGYLKNETCLFVKLIGFFLYIDPGRRSWVDSEVFYLPVKKDGKLLEIGFGSGEMLNNMQLKGWSVQGIDFDPNAVKNAKSKGLNVSLGSLTEQSYRDNSFDAIVMSHVLEHVHQPVEFIKECLRLLKSDGRLISITPNSESLAHLIFKENWRGLEPPRHINLLNSKNALKLLKQSGFSKIKVDTNIRGANGVMIASRYLKNENAYKMDFFVPLKLRLLGVLFQYTEWFLMKFHKSLGEELLIIAKK